MPIKLNTALKTGSKNSINSSIRIEPKKKLQDIIEEPVSINNPLIKKFDSITNYVLNNSPDLSEYDITEATNFLEEERYKLSKFYQNLKEKNKIELAKSANKLIFDLEDKINVLINLRHKKNPFICYENNNPNLLEEKVLEGENNPSKKEIEFYAVKSSIKKGKFFRLNPKNTDIADSVYEIYQKTKGDERKNLLHRLFHKIGDPLILKKGDMKNKDKKELYSGLAAVKFFYKEHDKKPQETKVLRSEYRPIIEKEIRDCTKKYCKLSDEERLDIASRHIEAELEKDGFSKLKTIIDKEQIKLEEFGDELKKVYFRRFYGEKRIAGKTSKISNYLSKKIENLTGIERSEYQNQRLRNLYSAQALIKLIYKNPKIDYASLLEDSKRKGFADYQSILIEENQQKINQLGKNFN